MTQKTKEISAQKLCAGTVPMAARRAGGLYERTSFVDAWACEAAKLLMVSCRGKQATRLLQRTTNTIPYF
jgi:hypothetical protein